MGRLALIGMMLGLAATTVGCEKRLFPENVPRSQFERYDRLRGRYTPTETLNAYGGAEPALRERLSPYQQ